MAAAAVAAAMIPENKAELCTEVTKALLGLAGMTNNFHLLQGETTFKTVLVNANSRRLGTKEGWTMMNSVHKHLMQLVIALRKSQGIEGLELDDSIAMPSPPRSALGGIAINGDVRTSG